MEIENIKRIRKFVWKFSAKELKLLTIVYRIA